MVEVVLVLILMATILALITVKMMMKINKTDTSQWNSSIQNIGNQCEIWVRKHIDGHKECRVRPLGEVVARSWTVAQKSNVWVRLFLVKKGCTFENKVDKQLGNSKNLSHFRRQHHWVMRFSREPCRARRRRRWCVWKGTETERDRNCCGSTVVTEC